MKTDQTPTVEDLIQSFVGGRWLRMTLTCGLALLGAVLFSGCRSLNETASASFASVVISGRSVQEIEKAADAVFKADGYSVFHAAGGGMVFEKEGSRKDQIFYSGVSGTHYGKQVNVRVRAEIIDLGAGSNRLQCQTFMVRDAGSGFFEEEVRLPNRRGRPYQKLLDEVASRLK